MRLAIFLVGTLLSLAAVAQEKWVTAWAASVQGPYPVGNPSAQPKLDVVFPAPESGARDQSFRLVVRPAIWGREARIRLSNAFGTRPVTFNAVYIGLQHSGPALVKGTNRPVAFSNKNEVTVAPGESVWSDAVVLPFARNAADPLLHGRKLAVSLHVVGESGPMTWHAKALQTSYVNAPGGGAHAAEEAEAAFPYSTASWYFFDALDVKAPAATRVIVAFGDSITDGTASTMNGDDRWPDVLARRLHAQYGNRIAVVNAGIGGNQIAGPAEYSPAKPFAGGPASGQRLRQGVGRLRSGLPGVRVIGATVVTALGSTNAAHGSPEQDEKRKALNAFIRTSGVFDSVIDFDAVVLDAASGAMRAEFVPESTTGGAGDKLHPNRAGYLAMGMAIDLKTLTADLRP